MIKQPHKYYLLFLLLFFQFTSCEPDDLTKPVRVNLEISFVNNDNPLAYFTFHKIIFALDKINFYGIRQEGNDVLFSTRPGDNYGLHTLSPVENSSYVTYFDLPQGVYQLMRWELEIGEIEDDDYYDDFLDSDDFGLIIEATYTRTNGSKIAVFIAIEEEELIVLETIDKEGKTPISVLVDNIYNISVEINPHALMRGIPRSMIENAETEEEDDLEFIEISEDENEDLYKLFLLQLSRNLKAVMR